jgi:alkanesulfonate monooxygenase SsuD/methylene tetrahydromethanopterin reductase-like flavin-dependent oxidoreductase (luciferase family)
MRHLWTDEEAEYQGTYMRLPRSWSWPKPAQRGGPPILIGAAAGSRTYDRVAAWADGWIPMSTALLDEAFSAEVAELHRVWEKAGRNPEDLDISVLHPPAPASGLLQALERADELGVRRVLLQITEEQMPMAPAIVDEAAAAIDQR